MTTIAVQGDEMSCDGLSTGGYGRKQDNVNKIMSHKGELWGFAGKVYARSKWVKWIDGGRKLSNMPKEAEAIRLSKGEITIYNPDEEFIEKMRTHFAAIGSGRCFAIGALEAGATASEAVSIACAYDVTSSGSITTVKLGDITE